MVDNDWNFLVIGSNERVLELGDNTEVVYGVICLGEASGCFGSYGDNETPFQQAVTGEVREFYSPSHLCTIHVLPCAIVFGKCPPPPSKATPSYVNAINSKGTQVFNRIFIEACCVADSVLCAYTKTSKGCLNTPITEQIDFTSQEAAITCSENL
eukprot:7806295-Heterocapsa_arctica.AAC.1